MRPPIRPTRRSLLGLSAATGALALGACSGARRTEVPSLGPPAGKDASAALDLAIWDREQEPMTQQLIAAFREQYPGISVTVSVTPFVNYWDKLQTQATGDDLPDLFWMNGPHVQQYAAYGKLQDLSALEGFDRGNYPPALGELYSVDGAPYAVPKDFDTIALWYNQDLLHRAGVDDPTGDWSWEDYRGASATVTRALADERVWGNPGGTENQAYLYPLILQAGGYVISEDGKHSGYATDGAIDAFGFVRGMIEDGIAPSVQYSAENAIQDVFAGGRAALFQSGNWQTALLRECPVADQIRVAPLMHGAQEGNVIHGVGYAMSSTTPNQAAAHALLSYLGSREANLIQARSGAANPAFIGTNDEYVASVPEFDLQTFITAAETAKPYPVSQNTAAWLSIESLAYPGIIGGPGEIRPQAEKLAAQMDGVLADEH